MSISISRLPVCHALRSGWKGKRIRYQCRMVSRRLISEISGISRDRYPAGAYDGGGDRSPLPVGFARLFHLWGAVALRFFLNLNNLSR